MWWRNEIVHNVVSHFKSWTQKKLQPHHTAPNHITATTAPQMCPLSVFQRTRFLHWFIRRTTCHLRHKTCSSTEPSACTQTTNRMWLVVVYAYPSLDNFNCRSNHATYFHVIVDVNFVHDENHNLITWHNSTRPKSAAKSPIIHIRRASE